MDIINISIVTVGMNHISYIKALYKSLYEDNRPNESFESIYIDNCSTDGTVAFLTKNYPQVKIIRNIEPLGFAENNNKGVMASIGKYIAIINPDIVLQKGSLDTLYCYAESHPNAGIIVPKLLNPDGSIQFSTRGFITLKMFFSRLLSMGNDNSQSFLVKKYLMKDMNHDMVQYVPWAMGAAMLFNRHVYAELGGFNTDYFLYFEDEDICYRSWVLRKPVVYLPDSQMIHNHLRGSRKLGKRLFMHFKSLYIFLKTHGYNINSEKLICQDS